MTGVRRHSALAERMTKTAKAFVDVLDVEQRTKAVTTFDAPDRTVWTYLPGVRTGLSLAELTDTQRDRAYDLIDAGSSPAGARTARAIIELDAILRGEARRGQYWLRILGEPGPDRPWAWRIGGHHLCLHLTLVGDRVAATPQFFGAEPATVLHGPHAGLRTLPDEEELGRALLASLDVEQRALAIVAPEAPGDILTRFDPVADPSRLFAGLAYARMHGHQRELLRRLVRRYLDRVPLEVADATWADAERAGLDAMTFAWAGSDERGRGHYYSVLASTFLLEYDNTQDQANHIHSVWRDLRHDWGVDQLAAHYAAHPH